MAKNKSNTSATVHPVDGLQSTSMKCNKSCHLLYNAHDEYFWK